jgi:dCTP deaminase
MILTDREIRIALHEKSLIIEPTPDLAVAVSSTAIDLTLADSFKEWPAKKGMMIRPGAEGYSYSEFAKLQQDARGPYTLQPQSFVLAWTTERVTIPHTSRLAARVEGKSSLARLGIGIHVTAPIIHSGFTGQIQLEMFNFGPNEVMLDPGMWVCQLVFEQTTGTPERGYAGIFAKQTAGGLKPNP